jgi:hypothetical protein
LLERIGRCYTRIGLRASRSDSAHLT